MSNTHTRKSAAVLISGSGTNLQSFINKMQSDELDLDIAVVLSNKPGAPGIERAKKARIPVECVEHGDYANRELFDAALNNTLDRYTPDLVILAGFMRILTPVFIEHFEGRVLNIHPSLLPKYPGLDTHRRAIDADDEWAGSTVHFATRELDGGPRIIQGRVRVETDDTPNILAARVLEVEHEIYPMAAALYTTGRLKYRGGAAYLDGNKLKEPIQFS